MRRPSRSIVAVVTTVLVAGAAGGAWAWDSHQDDAAAAHARAVNRTAAVVDAQVSDGHAAVGHDVEVERAQAASVLAGARDDLQGSADAARSTLGATDGQVTDGTVREALAAQVAAADALLAAVPAAVSSVSPAPSSATAPSSAPTPGASTPVAVSAAALREMAVALAAGSAAVVASHGAWAQQQAALAAAKAASPKPRATKPATPTPATEAPSCETTYTGPPFYTSPPTEGGDGSNGKLPPSALTAISWATDPHGTPYYLRSAAAAALERLDRAFRAAFGHHLALDLTYRDYDTQVAMRAALGTVAATPGTSTHGTGLALDVPELPCEYGWDTPQRDWLITHGPAYGWTSPSWAHSNGSNPEYWHFEFVG
ncbi:D-alanyl-D-alanine carboxypeptidase family protein [Cellulomonas sp. URHE0023]|uniref:M15 family metallopeptidase n=1 Tax=Cellulomonas sp. URHE0023 TaxID=1380354 RepID=UPI00069083C0|nr:M15 family metallopeptidase [Cellulomonas sp. URHE0023]